MNTHKLIEPPLKNKVEELTNIEERFKKAQALAKVGSYEINLINGDQYWSDELHRILGWYQKIPSPEEYIAMIVHPHDRKKITLQLDKVLKEATPFDSDYRIIRPDGSVRHVTSKSEIICNDRGEAVKIIGSLCDITDRKKLEIEVGAVSERVRQCIGQDVHDDIGSRITAISLYAQGLLRDLEHDKPIQKKDLDVMIDLLYQAAKRTGTLADQLLPVEIGQEGLTGALDGLVASMQVASDAIISFEKKISDDFEPEPQIAVQLFRIAQEAINNAIKHAAAERICIRLEAAPDVCTLLIEDDGIGIGKPEASGLGLLIMEQRARHVNARLEIEEPPGRGTLVRCTVP